MKFCYIFIVLLILLFSQCFSYIGWNPTLGGQFTKVILLVLLVYCVINIKKIPTTKMNPFVLLLMILPFVSILSSYSIHGQNVGIGFQVTMFSLTYLFYFILYLLKIDSKVILKMCLLFGIFWVVMEVVQQITYPTIWFATRYDTLESTVEIRNGIYRYNMEGREFGLILLFYCFQKYVETQKRKFIIGIVFGLVGIYLLATRQIMVTSAFCLIYGLFAMHKIKITSFLVILLMVAIVYLNFDTLFGGYVEMSQDIDSDNIRVFSYNFYGLEYNHGQFLPFLIGNGIEGDSSYGKEIAKFQEFGLWRADIGIVGMYSLYGIIYVLTVIAFFIYIFIKRKSVDVYLKMYVLYMFVTSIMLHHFGFSTHHIMTLCIILYLIDTSILNKVCNK